MIRSTAALLAFSLFLALPPGVEARGGYCVVVSRATNELVDWKPVVKTLVAKHDAEVIVYGDAVTESLEELRRQFPRHTCFVATPKEATGKFVAEVHRLTRQLDTDPYTDTLWGILTGYDAKNALAIAHHQTPLTVRKVASGTELALECCVEGLWYDELVKNKMVRKKPGGVAEQLRGPAQSMAPAVFPVTTGSARARPAESRASDATPNSFRIAWARATPSAKEAGLAKTSQ